jgi:energy-coupling factor transporter ATP-binding protein EcfA2
MQHWSTIYRQLAELLSEFYENNRSRTSDRLFQQCLSQRGFLQANNWMSKFMQQQTGRHLDPIHILASISDSKLSPNTRVTRINYLLEVFNLRGIHKEIDFTGCPTPMMIRIMSRRPLDSQREIWKVFNDIVKINIAAFDKNSPALEDWYGINLPAFSIFLFWIDPKHFLPLDNNTIGLLKFKKIILRQPKTLKEYLQFIKSPGLPDFLALSTEALAYRSQNLVYKEPLNIRKARVKQHTFEEISEIQSYQEEKNNQAPMITCKMIGIRVYEPTPDKWVKVLKRGKIYTLYSSFGFDQKEIPFRNDNDQVITYDSFRDPQLYNLDKFNISISAIVGENGSGKSTLTELIFLAINNLTARDRNLGHELEYVEGLCLDFFFMTDSLYKLTINLNEVSVWRYQQGNNQFIDPEPVSILSFELEQLFYTICINHSMYALNSRQMGNWINPLVAKNDQYQVPIAINPYREEGNININTENKLVRSRLLSTLLVPIEEFNPQQKPDNIRKLTNDGYAEWLDITFVPKKIEIVNYEKGHERPLNIEDTDQYWNELLNAITEVFNIMQDYPRSPYEPVKDFRAAAFMYLVKKTVKICLKYPRYQGFFNSRINSFTTEGINLLIKEILTDTTHATHKFYQTIHFLKYHHLSEILDSTNLQGKIRINISKLAFDIEDTIANLQNKRFGTIHFIPPPFLDCEIILTGDVALQDLSSGEKQRIFSVTSLGYHLINLDSNTNSENLNHYSYINIMFDEIELYFHPEMQQSFLKYLLDYLDTLEVQTDFVINILFITHSPFILSDIPSDNILFLGNKVPPGIKTFGANIHTLLAESFFLEHSFMGDFARTKINDLINFLIDESSSNSWNQDSAAQLISLIGEPLLKDRLLEIYKEKYQKADTKEAKIRALENQIQILNNEKN